jgi:nitrogen-specific signal transduction histidine kinase
MPATKSNHETALALLRAQAIITILREPFLVLDKDLRVVSANGAFYATFKVKQEETVGTLLSDLGNRQWDIPKLTHLLKEILPRRTTVEDFEVEHSFPEIGQRIMILNARRIPPPPAKPRVILLAIEDVTEQREAQKRAVQAAIAAEKLRKVEESEAELKKSMEIIERMNKLMVGRELEMAELKKQIAALNGKHHSNS